MRDLETILGAITIAETATGFRDATHELRQRNHRSRGDVTCSHQQPQIRAQLSNILMVLSGSDQPAMDESLEALIANSAVRKYCSRR